MALNSSTVAAGDVTLAAQYNDLREDTIFNAGDYAVSTGAANTYLVTLDAQITAYAAGLKIRVKLNIDNTGASTINVNSLGAKTIKKNAGAADVAAGDLQQDGIYDFVYDGTNFQVQALSISGLPSVATEGDLLYYDGSAWALLNAGVAGQRLQTNGNSDAPSWEDNAPPNTIPASAHSQQVISTDDIAYFPYITSDNLTLYQNAPLQGARRYNVAEQSIGRTTLQATATQSNGAVVVGGYVYWYLDTFAGHTNQKVWRADVTSNISSAANWTSLTLSGVDFAAAKYLTLMGYGNGAFWFSNDTDNEYFPATLSGTTLTEGTPITVTGSDYGREAMANDQGILARFASAPFLRLADFSGTLTGKYVYSADGNNTYSVENNFYLYDSTQTLYLVNPI